MTRDQSFKTDEVEVLRRNVDTGHEHRGGLGEGSGSGEGLLVRDRGERASASSVDRPPGWTWPRSPGVRPGAHHTGRPDPRTLRGPSYTHRLAPASHW